MPIVDPKVEIEFTAGTWTDVTADVDLTNGIAIKYGRTSEFSDAQTATCDFQLANHLGKYTPKAQLLADGTTAHPYYPNVVPRKRVRVSNTSGNRFLGYIKSWAPLLENGVRPFVAVSANDRQDQLSRIEYRHAIVQEHGARVVASGGSSALYLMSDPLVGGAVSVTFAENGAKYGSLLTGPVSGFVAGTFSQSTDPLPVSDGLTGLAAVAGVATVAGPVPGINGANFAICEWLTVPVLNTGNSQAGVTAYVLDVFDTSDINTATQIADIHVTYPSSPASTVGVSAYVATSGAGTLGATLTGTLPNDGQPHHIAVVAVTTGGTQTLSLYLDSVLASSTSFTSGQLTSSSFGQTVKHTLSPSSDVGFANLAIVLGPLSLFWGGTYGAATAAGMYGAGVGFAGEKTGARMVRLVQYAGLAPAEYSIDAGVEILSGAQGISGKSVISACQEIADTEGAGAAFYINTDGLARFCDRSFRKPAAPSLTLSAALDLDGAFAPTFDDMTLVNQSAVSRGGGNTLTYTDTASSAANGLTTDSATSYASTDAAALALAQQRVSSQSTPGIRIPQFSVDLLTSSVAASAFAGMQIGWRARINTLPVGVNSLSQVDVIIEGWAETITKTSWVLTFDASPADNPARFVWDDAKYGRWGPGATMTLTSSITAAATSISVTTSAGNPTFTLVAGAYPLPIKIGEEEMTITAAPGSSASPQALTVTRGTSGTRAAPQTAGARVSLSPSPTWSL